jgi:hypothetical protein
MFPGEHQRIEESIEEEELDGHIGHQQADYDPEEDYKLNWIEAMETDSVGGGYSDHEDMPLLVSRDTEREPPLRTPNLDQCKDFSEIDTNAVLESRGPTTRGSTGNSPLKEENNPESQPRITSSHHRQSPYQSSWLL